MHFAIVAFSLASIMGGAALAAAVSDLGHTALAIGLGFLLAGIGLHALAQARKLETASAEMRTRLDLSLARGRCGLWEWDLSRNRIRWSASMYALLGFEVRSDWMAFADVNALVHPADGGLYTLAERVAAAPNATAEHEFRLRTASGDWLWLQARTEVVIDPVDGTRHLVGIAFDISGERALRERSDAADARLRDAVEALSAAFVVWDADNRLVVCNAKFRSVLGVPAETAIPGTPYADVVGAGEAPLVTKRIERGVPGPAGSRSLEAQLADGRWLQIDERRTRDGGFVSVGTDITALKQHERQLMESERRLLASVQDLKQSRSALQVQACEIAALAHRYGEEKSRAECANRAKGEFLAKMSHELRTPLNAIIGFADVMGQELFGPLGHTNYGEYADAIRASGQDLLGVIDDILQCADLGAGDVRLAAAPVALDAAIADAMAAIAGRAASREVAITAPAADGRHVHADPRALHHVLVQILDNAVKFNARGGAVDIRLGRAGDDVLLFIADTGIGIPSSFLPRLARPFEQCEPEFSRSRQGFGIGLAIATTLARIQGGSLRMRSREDLGTVVMIRLPGYRPAAPVLLRRAA